MSDLVAAAPSYPHPTDEYAPTNENLWEKCLEVARGDRREYTQSGRTIHSPNNGKGYYPWPHPKGIAWAVKQYKGFNGGWRRREASGRQLLARMQLGTVAATQPGTEDHELALKLRAGGLVRLASEGGGWHYWQATFKGARVVRAGLGEDLRRKMDALLQNFDPKTAAELGAWIEQSFRVNSPKTPKGGKELKEKLQRMTWVLKNRASMSQGDPSAVATKVTAELASDWKDIEPHLAQLVAGFTDEGGKVVPKEIQLGGVTYVNEVGVGADAVEKYAKRLDTIFNGIKGWRAKAMKGGLKVVLSSPRSFSGTAGGKYKRDQDALYIRATPNVLKRGAGYGSFEYIIVHELGHRFERYNQLPQDFDKMQWWTTRYSRNEGESFAELFALSHFKLTGSWDGAVVDRFEQVMSGGSAYAEAPV